MQFSFRLSSGRAHRAFAVGLFALMLVPGIAARAQTPGDQAGVFAVGSVTSLFHSCDTCPEPREILAAQSTGGFGSHGPAVVGGFGARGEGDGSFSGRARILGPNSMPELRADARATPGIGTHPDFSETGFYFFNVPALVRAAQYYTYTGDTTQTYTMSYSVSGFADSTLDNPTPADEAAISVTAVVSLFDDGPKLGGERPMGNQVAIDRIPPVDGSTHDFRFSGSVSITLDPGDSYYLVAALTAQVSFGGQGIADAGQTLTFAFTAGDTSQLVALLPVPEPSTYALMGLGLMLTCLMLRRRRHA